MLRRLVFLLLLVPALASGQSVVISVRAVTGDLDSGPHLFGFHDDALMGIDPYDTPEPPTPPADYLVLSFWMPGLDTPLPNRWRDELRPSWVFEDRQEDWYLTLETDDPGTAILEFTVVEGEQYPLMLRVSWGNTSQWIALPGTVIFGNASIHTEMMLHLSSPVDIPTDGATWSRIKVLYERRP